jgi:hypothetical protein
MTTQTKTRSRPHEPRSPPAPGAGGSDPDRKGAWHYPADHERAGADLRHRDHIENPGHILPGHVRASNPRDRPRTCGLLQERDRPAPAHCPGRCYHDRALALIKARDMAVLPGHAEFAGRDRP